MPIEKEISELSAATSISGTNILHTKDGLDSDVNCTVQQVIDLVPTTDLSELIPDVVTNLDTVSDYVVLSDASDSGEMKRILTPQFLTALGLPTVAGSVTSGHYQVGDLQIRWGTFSSDTDAAQSISFSVVFTNECFGVWLNRDYPDASTPMNATDKTVSGFTSNRDGSIDGTHNVWYFAIGR